MTTNLRERKRQLLRATIERSAVSLVLEHGYDNVTVEMICEASMASPRTFFNYFGSKELAVLGEPPSEPDPALVTEFVEHNRDGILADLVRMMSHVIDHAVAADLDLWQDRREIIRRDPQLMRAVADRISAKETRLIAIVRRRLERRDQDAESATHLSTSIDDDLDREARLVVSLWWGLARATLHLLCDRPDATTQQITDDMLTLLHRIKES